MVLPSHPPFLPLCHQQPTTMSTVNTTKPAMLDDPPRWQTSSSWRMNTSPSSHHWCHQPPPPPHTHTPEPPPLSPPSTPLTSSPPIPVTPKLVPSPPMLSPLTIDHPQPMSSRHVPAVATRLYPPTKTLTATTGLRPPPKP
jgi:hypothetical protein